MNTQLVTKKPRKPQPKKRVPIGHDTLKDITPENAVDVFKTRVRHIYQGLPTRPSRYLLVASRRPTVPELMRGMRGMRISDTLPHHMSEWGLLMKLPPKPGRRSISYFITEAGLEVVRYWARTDRDFHAYANAYLPFDIDDRIKIMRADVALGVEK